MRFTPHPYQREAIQRILDNTHYGLLLDMGLGKTVITLTAVAELLFNRLNIAKVLIIAPKRVALSTWQDEAAKFDHLQELRFSSVLGSASQREKALQKDADIYVTSRDFVTWLCERYRYQLPFDMLVLDESSSFKNPQAKRFRALKKARASFSRIVILTGTPAPNSLLELWPQLYLLDAGARLGRTITQYRNTFFRPDQTNGYIVYSYRLRDDAARREIYRRIGTICMSLKAKDYLLLPERIENAIRIDLPPEAKSRYKQLVRDMVAEIGGRDITALNAAALAGKLLQLANGSVYDEDGHAVPVHAAKLEALRELAEVTGGPLLVFYNFRHDRERIRKAFPEARLLETAQDVRDWNAGTVPLLLAHPASCSYGLNLQAGGHTIVWYGLTWSLEQYQQANARLHRQGQDKAVIVHHLIAKGTIDEQVLQALKSKEAGQDDLLEAIKAHLRGENPWIN